MIINIDYRIDLHQGYDLSFFRILQSVPHTWRERSACNSIELNQIMMGSGSSSVYRGPGYLSSAASDWCTARNSSDIRCRTELTLCSCCSPFAHRGGRRLRSNLGRAPFKNLVTKHMQIDSGHTGNHVISIRRFKASRSTNLRNTPSPIATSRIFARKVLERFEESSVSRYLSFVSSVCLMRIPPYPRPGDWVCVYHNADQCHATGDTRLHLSPSSQNNLRHTSQRPRDAVIRSPDRVEGLVGLGR